MDPRLRALAVAGAAIASLGCRDKPGRAASPPPSVKVVEMRLGRSVGEDKRVRLAQEVFGPRDTFFLSVETEGTVPRAVLKVRWMRGSELLAETELAIAGDGPAVSEFHLSKTGGWPAGGYGVELLVDQAPAGRHSFLVEETP